jgi:predicted N-acetyltransferase YhbS
LAWIGMVLVDPESRKQGIGRQLLLTCLDHLRGQGIRCIKLDATPAGQVVYEKLGFEVEWSLARWMRPATQTRCTAKASPLRKSDWSEIERLDREAFGADRSALLRRLASDSAHSLIYRDEGGTMSGYGFLRGGINADYLGPIVIETGDSEGSVIAHTLIAETSRQLFWDIPDHCREAVALAKEHGFTIQRPFTRMYLGSNTTPGEPEKIWAISDPATG